MSAEIYQVWEYPDGRQTIVSTKGGEVLAEQRRRVQYPRLVDELVACSHRQAVAFWRRLERSRRPRREGDD